MGTQTYLIGLDYGSESARGVLIDTGTGEQVLSHTHAYRHGIMTKALADGTPLGPGWALQDAADYLEAARDILSVLGRGRSILSIGIGATASSPLPATMDGTPLSSQFPDEPHAYVKLWKHGAAQPFADVINEKGGAFLKNFGGKLSGEWLLAKAAQIASDAPEIWAHTGRFIESGDWLVWQLTGTEARSLGFAAYKAQYSDEDGYPLGVVSGLDEKLSAPLTIGSPAGRLSTVWQQQTGIVGAPVVAVSVIDSHVVLPAIGAVDGGCFVGALGTSAAYLFLSDTFHPLPPGIEGVALDGSVRGLWCYEAGQAAFGDMLSWFVRTFPRADTMAESFAAYNREAADLAPGASRLVGIDWWNGNRVPLADSRLSGLLVGLTMDTTAVGIYRSLMEALCFGARSVVDLFEQGALPIRQILMTSGLAQNNPLLVKIMADILGRPIDVPEIDNPTAVGAAIHGAVAAGLVADYRNGAKRYGARRFKRYEPDPDGVAAYEPLYQAYRSLCANAEVREVMQVLNTVRNGSHGASST